MKTMYEIYKLNNEWQVHTVYEGAYAGSYKEIMKFCIRELRLPAHELEAAVMTMERNGHNASKFNLDGNLIFTFDKNIRNRNS